MVCAIFFEKEELDHCYRFDFDIDPFNHFRMAGWMKIYRIIRMIHLISSMILLVFLVMYTVTGIIITHHGLPYGQTEVSKTVVPVERTMDSSPSEYARYLKRKYGYKGKYEYRQQDNGNWIFNFHFPGEQVKVSLTPSQDTLFIEHTQIDRTLMTVAHNLHGLRGFTGGWVYIAWAIFYDLSAIAFILFGITGIYMWFRSRKLYPSGWWFLAAGIIFPLAIVFAFLFSR